MRYIKILFLLLSLQVLIACNSVELKTFENTFSKEIKVQESIETNNKKTITIWATENMFNGVIEEFQLTYPNIEVKIEIEKYDNLVNTYQESIIDGSAPDIFMIPNTYLGDFSGIDGLENLLEAPYLEEAYFSQYPEGLLYNARDIQGEKMFAMPLLSFPYVTFYREDILSEYGYPTEPKALTHYLAHHENFIRLASTLHENNHYILESEQSILTILNRSQNYFDSSFDYLGKQGAFKEAINGSIAVQQNELSPYLNIWDDKGKEALKNDELVMFYMASYGEEHLQNWVPEQSGKWRIAELPFGLTGLEKDTSSSLAISSTSEQKLLAFEFVKIASKQMLSMYTEPKKVGFFGEQDVNNVYWDILEKGQKGQALPLDRKVKFLWDVEMNQFNYGKEISSATIDQLEKNIVDTIRVDQRALQNLLEKEKVRNNGSK